MYCKKCGNQVEDNVAACPTCGEKMNSEQSSLLYEQAMLNMINKKPVTKKWWFWLIIIVVVLGIAIAVFGGGGDSDKDGKETVNVNESATEGEPENVYKVGEVFNSNGLKIKFISAEIWNGYDEWSAPEKGNVIVRYYFEVENTSDSDKTISVYDFEAYADDESTQMRYFSDDISLSLSSGRSGNGYVYFEVPENAKRIEAEYEYDWWTDGKIIFLMELN